MLDPAMPHFFLHSTGVDENIFNCHHCTCMTYNILTLEHPVSSQFHTQALLQVLLCNRLRCLLGFYKNNAIDTEVELVANGVTPVI